MSGFCAALDTAAPGEDSALKQTFGCLSLTGCSQTQRRVGDRRLGACLAHQVCQSTTCRTECLSGAQISLSNGLSGGSAASEAHCTAQIDMEHQSLWNLYQMRALIGKRHGEWIATSSKRHKHTAWATVYSGPDHILFGHDSRRGLQVTWLAWPLSCCASTGVQRMLS